MPWRLNIHAFGKGRRRCSSFKTSIYRFILRTGKGENSYQFFHSFGDSSLIGTHQFFHSFGDSFEKRTQILIFSLFWRLPWGELIGQFFYSFRDSFMTFWDLKANPRWFMFFIDHINNVSSLVFFDYIVISFYKHSLFDGFNSYFRGVILVCARYEMHLKPMTW